jgi:hypothetical protein
MDRVAGTGLVDRRLNVLADAEKGEAQAFESPPACGST